MATTLNEPNTTTPWSDLITSQELIRHALAKFRDALDSHFSNFPAEVQTMLRYIHRHLFEKTLTVERIRKACGLANNNVSSRFKQCVGVGPCEYIAALKLRAASSVLRNGDAHVYLLASAVGYTEEAFSRLFKKTFHCTPTQYRRQNVERNGQEK